VTGAERAAQALGVWCGFCWAAPGVACSRQGAHLVRYAWAFRQGLIARADLVTVCRSVPAVTAGQLVTGLAAPAGAVAADDQRAPGPGHQP
jgi:hypothetical protein